MAGATEKDLPVCGWNSYTNFHKLIGSLKSDVQTIPGKMKTALSKQRALGRFFYDIVLRGFSQWVTLCHSSLKTTPKRSTTHLNLLFPNSSNTDTSHHKTPAVLYCLPRNRLVFYAGCLPEHKSPFRLGRGLAKHGRH